MHRGSPEVKCGVNVGFRGLEFDEMIMSEVKCEARAKRGPCLGILAVVRWRGCWRRRCMGWEVISGSIARERCI
jgi:hypothetical protein